jgi:hypothetical protein
MQTELEHETSQLQKKIDGVVIGLLLSIDSQGKPLVAFPGNPEETAISARTTKQMQSEDIGSEVALVFEGGDPQLPLIIGKIQHAEAENVKESHSALAELDGESIVLSARQNITLKCGKASITLTKAGKVILRGAYLLSRSSGVNRIKGGSVQIN